MFLLVRDQRGFTLGELLVVIAILGLMLAGLLTVQMAGQQSYLIGSHRVEAQQNGRIALELMVRELRSATVVTAIPSATDISFQYKDVQGGVEILHTVRYQLAGAVLNRTFDGVTTPLIGGVVTFNLTYFSAYVGSTNTGTPAADNTQVRLVRVQLVTGTEESVASYSDSNQ
ncbi:MAG TPA: prepilin-type N-terminal cleavage/methylation domain-containing protein, partial [Methylomirabilota bacterium]|nr:prepilin-type N-terminal cleavage/methylation domain-containing protein [Methylomirabilota bacterium]